MGVTKDVFLQILPFDWFSRHDFVYLFYRWTPSFRLRQLGESKRKDFENDCGNCGCFLYLLDTILCHVYVVSQMDFLSTRDFRLKSASEWV